jgi:CelD/BcsL family acetyltransferase involved in cellulose biosynthesis
VSRTIDLRVYASFDEAREVWRDVEGRGSCFVFQSHDWCRTWFETIGRAQGIEARPVYARDPELQVEVLLPLGVRRKRWGVRCLEFLGSHLADHAAPIVVGADRIPSSEWMSAILRRVQEAVRSDVADFWHLRADVDGQPNPLAGPGRARAGYRTHSLTLEGSWEAYRQRQLSAMHRSNSRRCWRRLRERGTPDFRIAETVRDALAITEVTLDQKSRQLRERGLGDRLAQRGEFYRQLTREHHPSGIIHVSALTLDDRVLATHWGAVWRDRFLWLMPSFAGGEWSRFGAGRLLLECLLEWSFANGLAAFDLTIGDEGYKDTYCTTSENLYRLVSPRSALGWAYYAHTRLLARPPGAMV